MILKLMKIIWRQLIDKVIIKNINNIDFDSTNDVKIENNIN